jgi:hypothetical protein
MIKHKSINVDLFELGIDFVKNSWTTGLVAQELIQLFCNYLYVYSFRLLRPKSWI